MNYNSEWYYGKAAPNLGGTARTLDNVNGAVKLEQGILSMDGASVMDDSKSLLLDQDSNILERPKCSDKYYFVYGHDYRRQLKDFFQLCFCVNSIRIQQFYQTACHLSNRDSISLIQVLS